MEDGHADFHLLWCLNPGLYIIVNDRKHIVCQHVFKAVDGWPGLNMAVRNTGILVFQRRFSCQ